MTTKIEPKFNPVSRDWYHPDPRFESHLIPVEGRSGTSSIHDAHIYQGMAAPKADAVLRCVQRLRELAQTVPQPQQNAALHHADVAELERDTNPRAAFIRASSSAVMIVRWHDGDVEAEVRCHIGWGV
jgi:hypothetical protein